MVTGRAMALFDGMGTCDCGVPGLRPAFRRTASGCGRVKLIGPHTDTVAGGTP